MGVSYDDLPKYLIKDAKGFVFNRRASISPLPGTDGADEKELRVNQNEAALSRAALLQGRQKEWRRMLECI